MGALIGWAKKIIKKKVKMEIRREGKEVAFKMEPICWKQLKYNIFLLDIHKNIF